MSKKTKKATGSSRTPQVDPILIARGMSSRYLSTKTPTIAALSKDEIEKDLRHMEAYRNACIGYNQQFFVFKNQESVKGGTFGMFAPHPNGEGPIDISNSADDSFFSMPSKIDPEEEKRLALLRKKISLSEFKREQLETEYLSLRAHYVHASQLVRKTRTYEFGRWNLLREVMDRRGKVLGYMRLLVAMARDVEAAIVHRGKLLEEGVDIGLDQAPASTGLLNDKPAEAEAQKQVEKTRSLYEMWTEIEGKLKEAETACAQLETPPELLQMMISPDTPFSNNQSTHGYSTRSPPKRNSDDDAKKGRKRSSSVSTAEESMHANGENGKKGKGSAKSSLGPHLIPWDSMVEPSTPYGIPLLLSCLSSANDKAVGYLTDIKEPKAITWLESTLPKSTAAFDSDAEEVAKLTEEARLLEEEMAKEVELNTALQKQIIKSRERSDQMVALMQLLRTETEAALERHNTIMESPEARARAAELHKLALEEEKLNNPSGQGDEEEQEEGENDGDVDEVDSEEEESEGEGSNEEDDGEDEREDVNIKEITVGDEQANVPESDEESEEGEVAEDEDMIEGEPEDEAADADKKRGYDEGDESSSLTPPKRKRRF